MPSPSGYHCCYLRVDLSTRSAEVRPLSESVLRQYIGGVGLGTWLVLQEGLEGVDPFDPRMPIAFVFSPLVGTTLTTSAKFAVVAKSPLTQRLSDSLSSSHFAIAGKRAGFDAIVIVGAASEPMALRIDGTGPREGEAPAEPRARVDVVSSKSGPLSPVIDADFTQDMPTGERVRVKGPHGSSRPLTPALSPTVTSVPRSESMVGEREQSRVGLLPEAARQEPRSPEKPRPPVIDFLSATSWWGQSSRVAADAIRHEWGNRFRVAAIGPAGERLVRYATISSDGRHAGRGGLGAVLGSKNLKAIAVAGDHLTPQAHPEELIALSRDLSRRSFGPATEKYRELGTVSNLLTFNRLGTLPTRNFQSGTFEGAEQLNPESFVTEHPRTRESCAACTIGCEHVFHGLGKDGTEGVRLEYESLFALGPLCGISKPETVLQAAALCDEYGIDTISAGATIAFSMECAERGLLRGIGFQPVVSAILSQQAGASGPLSPAGDMTDTNDITAGERARVRGATGQLTPPHPGPLPHSHALTESHTDCGGEGAEERQAGSLSHLRFGDDEGLLAALRSIGERSGFGDQLAEGSRLLAAQLGPEAQAFAPHVKGLEIPGYEPRALQSMALGFAVSTRGADHNRSGAYQVDFSDKVNRLDLATEGVRFAIETENEAAVMDSLILCKFLRGALNDKYAEMARMLELTTGWSIDASELHEVAERIVRLRKWYNIRHGWTPAEDTLPKRFLCESLPDGASAGATLTAEHLQRLIAEYNTQRGWSVEGWMPEEQIGMSHDAPLSNQ